MIDKNYYQDLPKKRMGAGVLLFNENNELLVVRPCYKDYWSIPGGVVDENESPRNACIREAKEEIGLEISIPRFLCVDYTLHNDEKGESLQFIFYGGVLNSKQIANIKIDPREIREYKFSKIEDTLPLLSEKLKRRIPKCLEALKNNTALYLEDAC